MPVKEGGQSILHTIGCRQQAEVASRGYTFDNQLHALMADHQRSSWKFNEEFRFRVYEVATLLRETKGAENLPNLIACYQTVLDQIKIVGHVLAFRPDRHTSAAGESN